MSICSKKELRNDGSERDMMFRPSGMSKKREMNGVAFRSSLGAHRVIYKFQMLCLFAQKIFLPNLFFLYHLLPGLICTFVSHVPNLSHWTMKRLKIHLHTTKRYCALEVNCYLLKYSFVTIFVYIYFTVIMLVIVPKIYVCPGVLCIALYTNIISLSFPFEWCAKSSPMQGIDVCYYLLWIISYIFAMAF